MAKSRVTLNVALPIEEVFDYLADFSNTAEWDPGVQEAHRLDEGPIENGSRFRVAVKAGPLQLPLEYWITAYERPHRLALVASGSGMQGRDDIRLRDTGEGTEIDWRLDFGFRPPLGLLDPVMGPAVSRTAKKAGEGLETTLSQRSAQRRDG